MWFGVFVFLRIFVEMEVYNKKKIMKKLLFFAVGAFFMLLTACNTEPVSLEGSWIIETAYGQPVIVADTAMITFNTKEMRVAGCNGCNRFFGPYSVSGREGCRIEKFGYDHDGMSRLSIRGRYYESI